ncbi:MAG TPA: nicotinamide-nucleotide amidohydrolase family protein [Opitutaceae bacterium]|nr:nicotinamide-nucleotide amidohydrolase family protein [Opitutaceae bacterium]
MSELKGLMLGNPRLTLAVAESVTSGRLQARIGAISGASEFFLGGVTAYTLDGKVRHLGIDRAEAAAVNCVSARVAEQMARGACVLFGADVGAATTGYAEPSAEWRVAEPFAWWGLARLQPGGDFAVASGRVDCHGLSRADAQERVAGAALDALVRWVRGTAAARTP